MAKAPTFSIVTTCKGRLDDLKQSLPRFVAQADTEVIVVDYDCPQKSGDYVSKAFPAARVVSVADRPMFNSAEARNFGAAEARGQVLVFLDADVIVEPDILARVDFPLGRKAFVLFDGGRNNSLRGSCLVRKADFEAVGGYDELLSGYEGEDLDLYTRLKILGAEMIELDETGVEQVLEQSLEERLRFRPSDEIKRQFLRGQLYQMGKEAVLRNQGLTQIDLPVRKQIKAQVDRQLDAVFAGERDFEMTLNFPDHYKRGLLRQWEFSTSITVRCRRKP